MSLTRGGAAGGSVDYGAREAIGRREAGWDEAFRSVGDEAVAGRAGLRSGIAEVMAFDINQIRRVKTRQISSTAG